MNKFCAYLCWFVVLPLILGCGSDSGGGSQDEHLEAEAAVTPMALNFGQVQTDTAKTMTISVSNQGSAALSITEISISQSTSPEFTITTMPLDLTVEVDASVVVEVSYTPTDEGVDDGSLYLTCNDPSDPQFTIALSGTGSNTDPPVASNYEGFGAVTQGAESSPNGYETYHVTSLEDSGEGTLRDALSMGERLVVFDIHGTIELESDLNIPYSYITVDGASSPTPGITIVQPDNIGTTIEARSSIGAAHDIIIHHLRMDGQATAHSNRGDIWGLDGESAPVYNIIIDHVTAIASTDGVFDIWEEVHDVTLSWNLIMDTITACHLSTGDNSKIRQRISFHHNVFARNNERQIRLRHNNQQIDFVNNVIYGWGWMESGSAGLHVRNDSGEINPSLNVVNNQYHYVSGLGSSTDNAIVIEGAGSPGDIYFNGNLLPAGEDDAVSTSGPNDIPAASQVTLYDADTLHHNVVPHVGTQYPTTEEQQLLADIQSALD